MSGTRDGRGRAAEVRRDLEGAQAELLAVLDRVGPDGWDRPSPNEGWTLRSLLGHLASAEAGFRGAISRMAAGQGGVPDDFDVNRWNAGQLRRRAEVSGPQLRADLVAAHAELLALLDSLDEAALERRGRMSVGREGSVEDTFCLSASHKREHMADIKAALG